MTQRGNPLEYLLSNDLAPLFWIPKRTWSAWQGHIPFAHWLVHVSRPKTLVELGTHTGVSYSAFCDAAGRSRTGTRCFAVDTWKGDKHAGFYGEEIFDDFKLFHDQNFSSFSTLLRTEFDVAVEQFEDGEIDVLHIDGLHTYEAVQHDFETWLPKLSSQAVVLFHDTNERRDDFGVWRFWGELKDRYPAFEFLHSHGLGVLCVGKSAPEQVMALCSPESAEQADAIRRHFEAAGRLAEGAGKGLAVEKLEDDLTAARHTIYTQHEQEAALRDALKVEHTREIADRDMTIGQLQEKVAAQTLWEQKQANRIASLSDELRHMRSVNEAIRDSTSWRITAPLRSVALSVRSLGRAKKETPGGTPQISETHQSDAIIQAKDWADIGTDPASISLSMLPTPQPANEARVAKDDSKLVAFYLPQYHRIPENSEWWSPGFTEWTNVAKGKPNFDGHQQPNIPRELGFYDLTHPDTITEQIDLAKLYGLHAFCFYHYWFSGRRILNRPVEEFLKSEIDFNFCLCWANENWTRTWDGDTKSVLLEQKYSEGDAEAFIESLVDSFWDSRYIRIDGKPLLVVYRAKDIPDPKRWFEIWRERIQAHGFPGLHIAVVDFYDISAPEEVGADSLVEFPPHKFNGPQARPSVYPTITNPDFAGGFVDYTKVVSQSTNRPAPPFKLFRGIMPSWDNTARRQNTPTIVVNARPDVYGAWLRYLRCYTRQENADTSSRLIFVNAWNEWGEGCYLEPDQRWGLSFLEETLKSSHYEPESAGESSLEDARKLLFGRVAEMIAASGLDGAAISDNNSSVNLAGELAAYRPPSDFARKVAAALVKWPALYKAARFGYTSMRRLWSQA